MKLTIRQQMYDAVIALRREWKQSHGFSPWQINCGNCMDFAEQLQEGFPKGEVFYGEDHPRRFRTDVDPFGHTFFFIGRRYYDSESPRGVKRPDDLPFYRRRRKKSRLTKPTNSAKVAA